MLTLSVQCMVRLLATVSCKCKSTSNNDAGILVVSGYFIRIFITTPVASALKNCSIQNFLGFWVTQSSNRFKSATGTHAGPGVLYGNGYRQPVFNGRLLKAGTRPEIKNLYRPYSYRTQHRIADTVAGLYSTICNLQYLVLFQFQLCFYYVISNSPGWHSHWHKGRNPLATGVCMSVPLFQERTARPVGSEEANWVVIQAVKDAGW